MYDVIVIGSGAAGMMAAITASKNANRTLLLEKLPKLGTKLKATGGGRCNLTNTLGNDAFMSSFGRNGKFMMDALKEFDHQALIDFFLSIGVKTHAPDGHRVFPVTHDSLTILDALESELRRQNVEVLCNQKAEALETDEKTITGVTTQTQSFQAKNVIVATGGLGYPQLGAEGDGYHLVSSLHHKVTELYPAMMPLITKEHWVANCRADTIPKVEIRVDLKKAKKLHAKGDLIFTKNGIRGPVVLDFAREITPLLSSYGEVPLLLNLTKGMNEDQILKHFKANSELPVLEIVKKLLPEVLSVEICNLADASPSKKFKELEGITRDKLVKTLAWTPLTVTGHDGFKMAMITRGGISLKEIDAKTMQSKLVTGLYFCGEVMDLDGPCGGYNLQWSFASGHLAGKLKI